MTIASRLDSIAASSFVIGTTNASTPSSSSLSVTSLMSIPASASACRSALGSWSAVGPLTSARSPAASSVAIGIVLTVSGAISPSTYIVSG